MTRLDQMVSSTRSHHPRRRRNHGAPRQRRAFDCVRRDAGTLHPTRRTTPPAWRSRGTRFSGRVAPAACRFAPAAGQRDVAHRCDMDTDLAVLGGPKGVSMRNVFQRSFGILVALAGGVMACDAEGSNDQPVAITTLDSGRIHTELWTADSESLLATLDVAADGARWTDTSGTTRTLVVGAVDQSVDPSLAPDV